MNIVNKVSSPLRESAALAARVAALFIQSGRGNVVAHDPKCVSSLDRLMFVTALMVHFFQGNRTCNGTYDTCNSIQVGASNE